MITQEQYNTTLQQIRNLHIKINILDFNYQVLNEISGDTISGNISVDANSDFRRSCSITIIVTDSSFNVQSGGQIWLNRYIQIYTGIDSITTGDTIWNNQGIYLIDAPSWSYDAQTKTLSFNGLDLMSKMTGLRNGNLPGLPTVIPASTKINTAIISALTQLGGFTRYAIEETDRVTPYEIKIDIGGTVFDILSQLRDIYPMWQMYFDVDGVFHFEHIPITENIPIQIDDDIFLQNIISENVNIDFTSVKNTCEVIGKTIEPNYYADAILGDNGLITLNIPQITSPELPAGILIQFALPGTQYTPITQIKIKINNYPAKELWIDTPSNQSPSTQYGEPVYYLNQKYVVVSTFKQVPTGSTRFKFYTYGNTPTFTSINNDPNSPFSVSNIDTIRKVFYGGEYDNIYTDVQAKERAEWELYNASNLKNSIDLVCIPVYWLDVNICGRYTTQFDNQTNIYIIKSFNMDLSVNGTQTINMIRYYPYYQT